MAIVSTVTQQMVRGSEVQLQVMAIVPPSGASSPRISHVPKPPDTSIPNCPCANVAPLRCSWHSEPNLRNIPSSWVHRDKMPVLIARNVFSSQQDAVAHACSPPPCQPVSASSYAFWSQLCVCPLRASSLNFSRRRWALTSVSLLDTIRGTELDAFTCFRAGILARQRMQPFLRLPSCQPANSLGNAGKHNTEEKSYRLSLNSFTLASSAAKRDWVSLTAKYKAYDTICQVRGY